MMNNLHFSDEINLIQEEVNNLTEAVEEIDEALEVLQEQIEGWEISNIFNFHNISNI